MYKTNFGMVQSELRVGKQRVRNQAEIDPMRALVVVDHNITAAPRGRDRDEVRMLR
jgi:hypothetical protein